MVGPSIHARWPELPTTAVCVLGVAVVGTIGNLAALRLVRIHRRVQSVH